MVARSENLDRTVEDTTENSDSLDRTVEDTAANCLMLLSRVGECGGDREKRVFRCKTCMKEFSSFQALGGHRASHSKPINNSRNEQPSSSLSSGPVTKKIKVMSSHRCPICGVEFPLGQALGGHMRKHRKDSSGALVTRSLLPEATTTSTVTTLKKSSGGKRVACFDLGLDSMESMINLKFGVGKNHLLIFVPSLYYILNILL